MQIQREKPAFQKLVETHERRLQTRYRPEPSKDRFDENRKNRVDRCGKRPVTQSQRIKKPGELNGNQRHDNQRCEHTKFNPAEPGSIPREFTFALDKQIGEVDHRSQRTNPAAKKPSQKNRQKQKNPGGNHRGGETMGREKSDHRRQRAPLQEKFRRDDCPVRECGL